MLIGYSSLEKTDPEMVNLLSCCMPPWRQVVNAWRLPLDDCLPVNRKEASMVHRFCYLLIAIGLGLLLRATVSAQESFYKDKTIRIIVGAPPGGGYDTYSRLIARHIGKHILGNPTVIVENMPGAATLISANHVYKVAKPDGLSFGHFV